MDWFDEVKARLNRKRQILFSADSTFLQDLDYLLRNQSHQAVVLWAFDCAEEAVKKLEAKYPAESRPRVALETAKLWAAGSVKMPIAKREILNCHRLAKEIKSLEDIALCHAVGQACSTVHTSGHAMGFPIYDLTAVVRNYGVNHCRIPLEIRKQQYIERIIYWGEHHDSDTREWASFMHQEDL